MSDCANVVEDPDSPEIEYFEPDDCQTDVIPNSITDIQIKKWEKDDSIAAVNTITPKKAYMLDDDKEPLDFPAKAESQIQKPSIINPYQISTKSKNKSEIYIDLR